MEPRKVRASKTSALMAGWKPCSVAVFDALTLRGSMNARNVRGGTAPAQVRVQIERHLARLTVAV